LRKSKFPFLLSIVLLTLLTTIWLVATPKLAYAQSSSPVTVNIDHTVTVLDGGQVRLNDTIHLSADQPTVISSFQLGFPYKYKYRLAYCYAFNASNLSQMFNVSLDTGLGTSGYYGVTVIFPQNGIQLTNGQSLRFTTVFVFSNIVSSSTHTFEDTDQVPAKNVTEPVLTLDFPMYPSLPQNASSLNVTVFCPPNTSFETGNFPIYPDVRGDVDKGLVLVHTRPFLQESTYFIGWMNFTSPDNIYRVAAIDELDRRVEIDGWGNIFVTEDYAITSWMQQLLTGMRVSLLQGANNVSAWDAKGKTISASLADKNTTTYTISFGVALNQGDSLKFKLTYYLPSTNYLTETGMGNFDLNFPTAKNLKRVTGKLTQTISLPEGASIKEFTAPNIKEYDLQKGALQEEILFTTYNASLFNNLGFHITYGYSPFWASFRPTLWVTAIVSIAAVIALIWKAPKPIAPVALPGIGAKPQTLRAIISSYEEKTKILTELDSLERQAQKGRLPRRRYKVRRRMLESQLSRLNRDLVDLKQKAKSAGPKYIDIVKELEIAEAELEGIEVELRRTESRYRRGELSLDAYKRLQDQSNKRKERAKTIIEGALLRLSEGTA